MTDPIQHWIEGLSGSRLEGTFRLSAAGINDLLARAAGGGTVPDVTLLPENRLVVQYGVLQVGARLEPVVRTRPAPQITLVLDSMMLAWGLRLAVQKPFLQVRGREVTLDLGAIPALASWRDVWRHVRAAELATAPGALLVRLDVAISNRSGGAHG